MNSAASYVPMSVESAASSTAQAQRQTVAELFTSYEHSVFARTNRLFCWLLVSQWVFAIVLAVVWSPRAWAGTESTLHPHLIAAVALGGILVSLPIGLIRLLPHRVVTRHAVAVAQVSFAALLIHLTGGRIETHFHVFGSLAFLALYRDWRVLATATIVVTADHLLRGLWYSDSVYGVPYSTIWRTLEHAAWVLFEDVVLVWACLVSRREMWEICTRQDALATERARLKFIFESVPVGIAFVLPGEKETFLANPAHERITGISAKGAVEAGAFERATHPDDVARQRPLTAKFQKGEIDQFTIEKRYIHRSGKVVWANLTRRMFTDPVTGVKQSITTLADISDLKAAQEEAARQQARLKFIFDAVPVGFTWMARNRLGSRIVNAAHAAITGVPLEHCKDLERYLKVTHPDDRIREQFLRHQLLAGEIDHYDVEKRYVRPDGTICWTAETLRSFRDRLNGEIQEVTTLVDITERKAAEAKLAETHKQLVEASRQAGMAEVATGVLHNVGNVLNSVNVSATLVQDQIHESKAANLPKIVAMLTSHSGNLAEFLTHDPKGSRIPNYLITLATDLQIERDGMCEELGHLRKNIDHVKDIVAMQQSYAKVSGVMEDVAISELVEDSLRMNASALARHGLNVVRAFETEITLTIDRHKVLQILVNLIRNAKYACDDSGHTDKEVTIRVSRCEDRVRISVVDNGVGIAAENLTRIFAHGFTTRAEGHGFGLHSGALVAKQLGGSLTAHSDGPGKGATFTLELPYSTQAPS